MRGAKNMSVEMALNVRWQAFAEMSVTALYRALMLRQSVFVVEQTCAYLDADGLDEMAIHGLGHDRAGHLVAVARILPPGCKFALPSIGRIAVATDARRFGHGRAIVAAALAEAERRYPRSAIRVDAQTYLEAFYGSFGFRRTGPPFDEDGIPHIAMIRDPIR
jgi:ElaA protein